MRKVLTFLFICSVISACTGTATQTPAVATATLPSLTATPQIASATQAPTESIGLSSSPVAEEDFFSQMAITLPPPTCSRLTQSQTEGPYYKANTPERNSLLEEGVEGTRLILVGYVLDENCQPLSNTWLDFWQADASGEYDNAGYRLRGHQFTDGQGRYYLETILPGLYSSRPIEHIHVKVRPEGGQEITSQLYFPQQPIDGLTVTIENKAEYLLGYFDFVVQK